MYPSPHGRQRKNRLGSAQCRSLLRLSRVRLLKEICFVLVAWQVCESAAFDEVHYEIGYGFERHEEQHYQAGGQGAMATVKQGPSGHDCQMHRNDACIREEHHCSYVGFGGRLPLAIVEE